MVCTRNLIMMALLAKSLVFADGQMRDGFGQGGHSGSVVGGGGKFNGGFPGFVRVGLLRKPEA
jgi:hypothetical protein